MASSDGIFTATPEQLTETMNSVINAINQSQALGKDCNSLITEVVASGAFKGDAAMMAVQTMEQIEADLQKILAHGHYLAEHLGKSATVTSDADMNNVSQLQQVWTH
jgi:uncharacterized protein YukE